jgi:glyoxylase-like metal-dependent hydrolase (beta-lactamase superfamily II)
MTLEVLTFTLGPFATNSYFVYETRTKRGFLIDAPMGIERVVFYLKEGGFTPLFLINTHCHVDHVAGNRFFKNAWNLPLAIHPDDLPVLQSAPIQGRFFGIFVEESPPPDRFLKEGDTIDLEGYSFLVLHTPGHTPGGISLYISNPGWVFVGDTLFRGSIGRTDFPGGDFSLLLASIREKLFPLPEDTIVFPGHMETTTIGWEKRYNPFFR